MSRARAVWIALAVGIATVAALTVAARLRRRAVPATTAWAPDPGPVSIASAAPTTGDVMQATAPATAVTTAPTAEPDEQPLPVWARLTIVGLALLAFLAISLIATKGV